MNNWKYVHNLDNRSSKTEKNETSELIREKWEQLRESTGEQGDGQQLK